MMYYAMFGHCLIVSDPKIVQDMYTTHNKYFDKASIIQISLNRLIGRSLLVAETTPEWH
jgi:hypothetical protein